MTLPDRAPSAPAAQVETIDPRELDPVFRDLPDDVKFLVRERWRREDEQLAAIGAADVARRKVTVAQGCALFAGVELCVSPPDFARYLVAALVGAAVGWLWNRIEAGQVAAPAIAMVASVLQQLVWLNLAVGSPLAVLCAPVLLGCASAWLGMRRDTRHYD